MTLSDFRAIHTLYVGGILKFLLQGGPKKSITSKLTTY